MNPVAFFARTDGLPTEIVVSPAGAERVIGRRAEMSSYFPDLHVVDPDIIRRTEAEPAFLRMRESRRAMARDDSTVDAQAHLVHFERKRQIVPGILRLPRHRPFLRFQKGVEVGGQGFSTIEIRLTSGPNRKVADARLVVA